jgi:hypothetical protein
VRGALVLHDILPPWGLLTWLVQHQSFFFFPSFSDEAAVAEASLLPVVLLPLLVPASLLPVALLPLLVPALLLPVALPPLLVPALLLPLLAAAAAAAAASLRV